MTLDNDTSLGNDTEPGPPPLPVWVRALALAAVAVAVVVLFLIVRSGDNDGAPGDPPTASAPVSGAAPRAGSTAPEIDVPTLDGGRFSLTRHLAEDGRPLFVNMWAEWCFPCRTEMPAIDAASRAHPEIHFIGIVVRDREAPARRFVEEYEITYEIGVDAEGNVEQDYQVWVMPSTYLIGADGRVIERFFGPLTSGQLDELIAKASA